MYVDWMYEKRYQRKNNYSELKKMSQVGTNGDTGTANLPAGRLPEEATGHFMFQSSDSQSIATYAYIHCLFCCTQDGELQTTIRGINFQMDKTRFFKKPFSSDDCFSSNLNALFNSRLGLYSRIRISSCPFIHRG